MTKTEDGKLPGRCHLLRNGRNLQGQGPPCPVTVTGEGGRGSGGGRAWRGWGRGRHKPTAPTELCRLPLRPHASQVSNQGSKCNKHPSPQLSHVYLSQRCSSLPLLSFLSAYVRAKVNYHENIKKLFPGCDVIFCCIFASVMPSRNLNPMQEKHAKCPQLPSDPVTSAHPAKLHIHASGAFCFEFFKPYKL